jgi:Bacterial archaeo-eukaryotic release factor family 3
MTPAPSRGPTSADLRVLIAQHRPPCISVYEPTHRSYPRSSEEDHARYRGLLRRAEASLRRKYPAREFRPVLEKLGHFAEDTAFWMSGADGLAVFGSPDEFRVFKLRETVPELLSVADTFHIKPLVRVLQRNERYQVLALTLVEARLYEGTREALDRVDLTGIPATLTAALGTQVTEPFLKVTRAYGGGLGGPAPMYHGQGSRKDERQLDRERFFRIIGRQILEHFSNRCRLPLVLAALPEHQSHFRELTHNPFLVSRGIEVNPDALQPDPLRKAAWALLESFFERRLEKLIAAYAVARGYGRGSSNPEEVAEALAQGRVGTLLVEANRRIPGKVDAVTGRITYTDPSDPGTEDVPDDLAEAVLRTRGEVVVVPAEKMPTQTGLAAIYRF